MSYYIKNFIHYFCNVNQKKIETQIETKIETKKNSVFIKDEILEQDNWGWFIDPEFVYRNSFKKERNAKYIMKNIKFQR